MDGLTAKKVEIIGIEGFPAVKAGDNLASLIVNIARENGVEIENGDIVVIAQKIVSKAEGRIVQLSQVKPSEKAKELAKITKKDPRFVELVLKESKSVVKASPEILIVKDIRGIVSINAGIDKSNVPGEDAYALLPKDPDASASKIRSEIAELTGKKVAVVICDTYSRPFRRGQVEFAIGVAGLKTTKDYRGRKDMFNYVLQVKNVAIIDEIACAAELVMGQGDEATPVAIIKNLHRAEVENSSSAKEIIVSEDEDLFKGTLK